MSVCDFGNCAAPANQTVVIGGERRACCANPLHRSLMIQTTQAQNTRELIEHYDENERDHYDDEGGDD